MREFKDLIFEEHENVPNSTQAEITFSNGVNLSVIFGKTFYSNGVDTYEAWAWNVDDCPRGDLTKEEVSEYMKELQQLETILKN